MDFGVVGFDNFSLSVSKNSSFASENGAEQKMYGSGNLNKKERTLINEEEDDLLRDFKMAKTTSSSSTMTKMPLQRCSNNLIDGHQQMLSFSSPTVTLPLYHQNSARNPGYGYGGLNSRSMVSEFRGPFTASQWMELEHQALIYKYITANVPIPSHLLNPITKAFHSSYLRPNALGWGGFHLGFSNTDPEPGRCRRTDGKKWRCSRDAVVDQKYCERHLNRGRNRSRKPVEPNSANAKLPPTASSTSVAGGLANNLNHLSTIPQNNRSPLDKEIPKDNPYSVSKQQIGYEEFGLVCSDSLLNPLNRSSSLVNFSNYGTNSDDETKSQHALRQFMDNWPKNQSAKQNPTISWPEIDVQPDRTQLSISIPTYDNHGASLSREIEATQMGLGVGSISAWESSMGGPLGEVLHTNGKALNLMENWNNSPSSPTRVLQRGAFGSLSNSSAGSSPRAESNKTLDGVSLYNGATIHPLVSGN